MITLLTGTNTFQTERELKALIDAFDGHAERIDGSNLEIKQLPDVLMGATLFAPTRLVIVKGLSDNKSVWADLYQWLPRVSDDIHLVLVDGKPDKRTVTYKDLKKIAKVIEAEEWTERDSSKAERWLIDEAKAQSLMLDTKSAQLIVRRVGVDQWALMHAIEKLALVDTVDAKTIELLIDASPSENVFNLFDAALRGNRTQVSDMVRTLELTEDPYRLFALLSGQAFQLAAVAVAGPDDQVAKDLGIHPYGVSKLAPVAKKMGRSGARKVIRIFASADDDMKLSRAEPWLLIERALMNVAAI